MMTKELEPLSRKTRYVLKRALRHHGQTSEEMWIGLAVPRDSITKLSHLKAAVSYRPGKPGQVYRHTFIPTTSGSGDVAGRQRLDPGNSP